MSSEHRPSLSIVIPTYNAASTLAEQLDALIESMDPTMELIVVDNGSTDASAAIAQQYADRDSRVRVVEALERQGEPHARNVGVAAAHCDLIAFCDADDVVAPGWATAMRDALRTSEYVTGPCELQRLNPPWLAGVRGRAIFSELARTVHEIPFAHGCNLGARRSTIERVGGFDENALIGCDVDFAIRANSSGVPISWQPEAIVHYRHRALARQRWRQAIAYGKAAHTFQVLAGERDSLLHRTRRQVRRIGWLLKTAVRLTNREFRAHWLWTLALVIGEIRGGGS